MDIIPAELHKEILDRCSARIIISAFVSKSFFAIGYAILRGRSKRPDLYDLPAKKLVEICMGSIRLRRKLCKNDYCLTVRGKFAICIKSACKSKDPDLFAMASVRAPQQAHTARIIAAAASGDNAALSSLAKDATVTHELLKTLAIYGKLHRMGVKVTKTKWIFVDACVRGNMETVKYLLAKYPEESSRLSVRGLIVTGLHADKLSCKKIFLYLLDKADVPTITTAMNYLCCKGSPWIIYAMISMGGSLRKRGVIGMCKGRRMDMMNVLCQYAGDLSEYMEYAGRAGDIAFIKEVHARGKCTNLIGAMHGACEMYHLSLCNEFIAMGLDYCSFCDTFL